MERLGVDDETPIESGLISKSIESAQTKVEGYNFDLRKHVVEYDDVVNKQREKIYEDRARIVKGEDMKDAVLDALQSEIESAVETHNGTNEQDFDVEGLLKAFSGVFPLPADYEPDTRDMTVLKEDLVALMEEAYEAKEAELGAENMRQLERLVMIRVIDALWIEYLTAIEDLRIGIGLQAFGQRDPLVSFKTEGFRMFQQLQRNIMHDIAHTIFHVTLVQQLPEENLFANATTNREEEESSGPRKKNKANANGGKVGRNALCPHGTGRKVKVCCGACGLANGCDARGVAKFGMSGAKSASSRQGAATPGA
jgi:preprotein translocase subunit SecA